MEHAEDSSAQLGVDLNVVAPHSLSPRVLGNALSPVRTVNTWTRKERRSAYLPNVGEGERDFFFETKCTQH